MTFQISHRQTIWLLAIFVAITFFANNHVLVPDIMESRNIVTAREMVYDGNWVVTTMNGDLRLEKPPLPTWATAIAEIISPDSLAWQRGMAGCAALLLVYFFYRFSKNILNINPVLATLVLCTCYNVVLMGRTASWDIYCHAFMMGAICFLAEALQKPGKQWAELTIAGIMTGLSIMSKGPVSLYGLFFSFIIAYTAVFRPKMKGKWLPVATMILIALAIGAWWFVYIHLTCPEALANVAGKESGAWFNRNVRPWYYYWTFFLETGIWSVAMITTLVYAAVKGWKQLDPSFRMSIMWLLVALLLLSLLPEKKNRYLLPILIPASFTIAGMLADITNANYKGRMSRFNRIAFMANGWILAAACIIVAAAAIYLYFTGIMPVLPAAALVCASIISAIIICSAVKKRSAMRIATGVAVLFASAECFAMPSIGRIFNNPEMRSIALTRDMRQLDNISFYHNADEPLRIELVYAANRKIKPLDLDCPEKVMAALPCAIMTHKYATQELSPAITEKIDTVYVGQFDDNPRPRGNRRYKSDVIYHLTILKEKK